LLEVKSIMHYGRSGLLSLVLLVSACSAGHDVIHGSSSPEVSAPAPTEQPSAPKLSGTVHDDEGLVAGANVNGGIARNLSPGDRSALKDATQKALEVSSAGIAVKWRNDETGSWGSVTPQPAFEMNGTNCREFQQHINAGGEMATGYGTACRDRRGIWRIAENG
jgi:surface antigen